MSPAISPALVDELPEPVRVALSRARSRQAMWLAGFALDARAARAVLGAREPIMAQLRLAWWRDQLRLPPGERAESEELLGLIGRAWPVGDDRVLIGLVDGWEALLAEPPLDDATLQAFADARADMAAALATASDCAGETDEARRAGRLWALADIAGHQSDGSTRRRALALAEQDRGSRLSLSRTLRPLAILGGLSRRALARGGSRLLGDRLSPIVALRLGLWGH